MSDTQIEPDKKEAAAFLVEMYRHRPANCFLTMVFKRRREPPAADKPPKITRARSYRVTEEQASFRGPVVDAAHRSRAGWDAYFTCALHRESPPLGKRGTESLAAASCFAYLDIDVGREGHKEGGLCPDVDAALEILGNWVPPTAIVLSGGGVHAYWRFDRPWIIDSEESRAACKDFHRRFQAMFRTAEVNPRGYRIDDTHNLAQILRLPGTFNWKSGAPRPVKLLELHPGFDYVAEDLLELLDETAPHSHHPLLLGDAQDPGGSREPSRPHCIPSSSQQSSSKPATATTLLNARRYAAKFEPAITGTARGRHHYGFLCVLKMIGGQRFSLSDQEALEVLREWAATCVPPFTDRELLDMMEQHRRGG